MALPDFLLFASDAEIVALCGGALLLLAALASLAERRRLKRARIDRVGWVPWTGMFLVCAVVGISLIALAAKGLLAG
jgi:hypothetical protein